MGRSLFYITVENMEEAEKIAEVLIKEKLAACVNVIPGMRSFFCWEGEVQSESEILVIGKTKSVLVEELVECVKKYHSYELPCVITFNIEDGNPPFLEWIDKETR